MTLFRDAAKALGRANKKRAQCLQGIGVMGFDVTFAEIDAELFHARIRSSVKSDIRSQADCFK